MPNHSPHDLKAGMALADDVYNLDAKLLFPSGTILNEKRIEILMMWGVENVTVQGSVDDPETVSIRSFSNTVKQDAELAVQKRFKLVKSSHPAVIAIRELAVLEMAKSSDAHNSNS
ncbi:hypothetical protein [Pelagicoccus mobilis]|uniref:Uncharacterized protein n=1 Tax=Pelagicoccus mobilis TaxID=415221 RepID=A0A934VQI8_9BACT|nr:hypothetical protein [Pelagicoccus mobilis]MBK1876544.1 hypothetical protein [Pelagicoccus mobilis]